MADSKNNKPVATKDPADDSKETAPKTTASKNTGGKKNSSSVLLYLLLIFVASATSAGGYYLWQQQQLRVKQHRSELANLQQAIDQLSAAASKLEQSTSGNTSLIQKLGQQQSLVEDAAKQAIEVSNRGQRGWVLAEIDYLLRLASRRLQIARDINSAIAALTSADQRLHDLADLNLLPIRQQLAQDIAKLKALHQVDVSGTALALEQMLNLVADLPFKSVEDEVKSQFTKPTEKPTSNDEGFVDSVLNTVMNIGDIKVHQRSLEPASSSEQQQQLEQMLRNHLLSARLSVLRYDQNQYVHDLEQAQKILHLHYKSSDNRVDQMMSDLVTFTNINLKPDLPDIATAWNMLQDAKHGLEVKQPKQSKSQSHSQGQSQAKNAGVL